MGDHRVRTADSGRDVIGLEEMRDQTSRGTYRNDLLFRRARDRVGAVGPADPSQIEIDPVPVGPVTPAAAPLPAPKLPASTYQRLLNQQANRLFWDETHYKPNRPLDRRDARDRAMIQVWIRARDRVARAWSPLELLRGAATSAAFESFQHSGLPFAVYAVNALTGEGTLVPFNDLTRAYEYAHPRLLDSPYVALFDKSRTEWPRPIFDNAYA